MAKKYLKDLFLPKWLSAEDSYEKVHDDKENKRLETLKDSIISALNNQVTESIKNLASKIDTVRVYTDDDKNMHFVTSTGVDSKLESKDFNAIYNKGVSYADSRVNTSSESYKTGLSEGKLSSSLKKAERIDATTFKVPPGTLKENCICCISRVESSSTEATLAESGGNYDSTSSVLNGFNVTWSVREDGTLTIDPKLVSHTRTGFRSRVAYSSITYNAFYI